MSGTAVRLANWGHRQPSVYVRRSVLILAIAALVIETLVVWLILYPMFTIAYAPLMAVTAFAKALIEVPRLSYNSASEDAEKWARNWQGAQRIWRERKQEARLITPSQPQEGTHNGRE